MITFTIPAPDWLDDPDRLLGQAVTFALNHVDGTTEHVGGTVAQASVDEAGYLYIGILRARPGDPS